jgi:hypothetical protein
MRSMSGWFEAGMEGRRVVSGGCDRLASEELLVHETSGPVKNAK